MKKNIFMFSDQPISTNKISVIKNFRRPGAIFLCSFFISFLAGNLIAQNTLKGKITDKETKDALPGAVIYFPDLKISNAAKIDGTYEIKNLPKIKTIIQVKMTGYKTIVSKVDLAAVSELNFELDTSVVEVPEVIVTGANSGEIKKNPAPMVIIDSKYLLENSATNIIDAMIKIPGVSAVSTGPNVSKPFIRGLGYNRILTLFDGIKQDGQQWGDEHGIEIDQYLIERIEVVKGPASLIYGSDALAGVINLLPANPAADGTMKASISNNYQTNNSQIGNSLSFSGNIKGFIWGLTASHKQAADYKNKYDGRVFGTKYNESDLNSYIGINKKWGYSHLNFSLYDNQQEIPDGSRDSTTRKFTKQISEADLFRPIVSDDELSSYRIAVIHQRVQHYRVYSSNNFIIGKSRLGIKLGFQQSNRREFSHPVYPDLAGLNLILNTSTYDVKYYLPEIKEWETTVGANGMFQQNKNNGATEFVIPDYQSYDAGFFIFTKRAFKKLDVAAGIRRDMRNFKIDSMFTKPNSSTGFDMQTQANPSDPAVVKQFDFYSTTFSGFSGSAGATYNFTEKFYVKINIARGYRSPNIAELSAKGVHPGTGFEQLGNPNFKPEFNLQEDLGIFLKGDHISLSAEIFNNELSNYIYNEKLLSVHGGDSLFSQAGNNYPVFKFRQTTAQLYGGEFSVDIHPHPFDWLHFENTASFISAVNLGGDGAHITDSTKYLPYIPPFHTNSELRADKKKKIGFFHDIFIKFSVQYFAAQNRAYLAYGTETKTPGYTLLNFGIGAEFKNKKGKTIFICNILGTNLADVAYQNNMSRLKYFDNYPVNGTGRSGIYNMGRNFSLKIIFPVGHTVKGKEKTVK